MKKFVCLILCLCMLLPVSYAENTEAVDISETTTVTGSGYTGFRFLTDKNTKTYHKSDDTASITLENGEGIGGVYLLMNFEYGEITVTDTATGKTKTVNENSFLHLFVDVKELFGKTLTSVSLDFNKGSVSLSEIYVFTEGETPSFVQKWNKPHDGGADLVLFATHGDDDQLFFAGLLPLFAGEKQLRVQVVYLTDHRNLTYARTHEILNGLWAVGVDAYPVMGSFADFRIDSLQGSYDYYSSIGVTEEMLQEFVVEQIRRFKPMVAVGHDINGEYGHGMHMVYTDLLIKALDISADETKFVSSAEKYGTWTVPKTYLHLYEENKITIDYDTPLDHFGGMTAFEVTQKMGYPCHESQQFTWFTDWINGSNGQITKASQIKTYNPCEFGLYRSEVGEDVTGGDFFENVKTYAQIEEEERIEAEKQEAEKDKETTAPEPETEKAPETEAETEKVKEELKIPSVPTPVVVAAAVILLAVVIGGVAAVCTTASRKRRRKNRYRKFMNKK